MSSEKTSPLTPDAKYFVNLQGTGLNIAVHFPGYVTLGEKGSDKLVNECMQAVADVLARNLPSNACAKAPTGKTTVEQTVAEHPVVAKP